MSGCEGCRMSPSGQVEELNKIREQAKAYGKEKQVSVAIWKEGNEFFFSETSAAFANGKPVSEVLSIHQGTPA